MSMFRRPTTVSEEDDEALPLPVSSTQSRPSRPRPAIRLSSLYGRSTDPSSPITDTDSPTTRRRAHTVSVSFAQSPTVTAPSRRFPTENTGVTGVEPQNETATGTGAGNGIGVVPIPEAGGGASAGVGVGVGGPASDETGRTSQSTRRGSAPDPHPPHAERNSGSRRRSSSTGRRGSIVDRVKNRNSSSSRDDARAGSPVCVELEEPGGREQELDDEIVGMLDVVDPHVSTVNSLQNMTNSLMIPPLPALWSRRPEVIIHPSDEDIRAAEQAPPTTPSTARRGTTSRPRSSTVAQLFPPSTPVPGPPSAGAAAPPTAAGLPGETGVKTAAEAEAEAESDAASEKGGHELDAHVRHILSQTKRDAIKRTARGVWTFVKTPMGAITAIYGFLVAFWGAAIVLFLLGWINAGSKYQNDVWVEISSQVENGLFTLTGVGLIPWRVIDVYRFSIIWTLKSKNERLRKKRGLPPIADPNDIPDPKDQADYVSVLSDKDQETLRYQQEKFARSQTWYRPHATATHRAFPMSWALWNTILMVGNSFFQCILCGCMWGMNWHVRPPWTTGTLIPLSFLCGIGAGVLIWRGSVRTRKRATVEDRLRQALGVPLALGAPRSKDGTILLGQNKAPLDIEEEGEGERAGDKKGISNGVGDGTKKGDGGGGGGAERLGSRLGDESRTSEGGEKEYKLERELTSGTNGTNGTMGTVDTKSGAGHSLEGHPHPLDTATLSKEVSPRSDRRTTVSFGTVREEGELAPGHGEGQGAGAGAGETTTALGRKRGTTVAAPGRRDGALLGESDEANIG